MGILRRLGRCWRRGGCVGRRITRRGPRRTAWSKFDRLIATSTLLAILRERTIHFARGLPVYGKQALALGRSLCRQTHARAGIIRLTRFLIEELRGLEIAILFCEEAAVRERKRAGGVKIIGADKVTS